jgi:hypothetical protein
LILKDFWFFTAGNIEKVQIMFESQQSNFARDSRSGFSIPEKLYRIGEIVRYTPYSRQTIHNYTIMGLIRETAWTEGGHRLYDESVFGRLSRITELRKTKTLSQIREILNMAGN